MSAKFRAAPVLTGSRQKKKIRGPGMHWPHTKFFLSLKIKNAEIC